MQKSNMLLVLIFLFIAGCSSGNKPTGISTNASNSTELGELYDQIDTDDWWFPGVVSDDNGNRTMTIAFSFPTATDFSIEIYDRWFTRAIRSFSGSCQAGVYEIVWDLRDENGNLVPPGVYSMVARASGFSETKQIVISYY